jgi:hypothetical protein
MNKLFTFYHREENPYTTTHDGCGGERWCVVVESRVLGVGDYVNGGQEGRYEHGRIRVFWY